jgi:hypothetical protein
MIVWTTTTQQTLNELEDGGDHIEGDVMYEWFQENYKFV